MFSAISRILNNSRNHLLMLTRSKSSSSDYTLHHEPNKSRFYITIGNKRGSILYNKDGKVLDLVETYIPSELRGKGLGCILADRVFDYVVKHDLKMKLTCPFLITCYEKNKADLAKYVVD